MRSPRAFISTRIAAARACTVAAVWMTLNPSTLGAATLRLDVDQAGTHYVGVPVPLSLSIEGDEGEVTSCVNQLAARAGDALLFVTTGKGEFPSACVEDCIPLRPKAFANETYARTWRTSVLSNHRARLLFRGAEAYRLRVELQLPGCQLTSNVASLVLEEPSVEADRAYWQAITDHERLAYVIDRPGAAMMSPLFHSDFKKLEDLLRRYPSSAYASAVSQAVNFKIVFDVLRKDERLRPIIIADGGNVRYISDVGERRAIGSQLQLLLAEFPSVFDPRLEKVLQQIGTLWTLGRPLTLRDIGAIETVIRDFYRAWGQKDGDALRAFVHPDFMSSFLGTYDGFLASVERRGSYGSTSASFRTAVESVRVGDGFGIPIAMVWLVSQRGGLWLGAAFGSERR